MLRLSAILRVLLGDSIWAVERGFGKGRLHLHSFVVCHGDDSIRSPG
jgi:hypothetical protein